MSPASMRLIQRLAIAVILGTAAAFYSGVLVPAQWPSLRPDLSFIWFGMRAWLAGRNPYDLVGPGREFDWGYPLLYPLTAMAALTPLSGLPVRVAETVFAGISGGLLAWALTRDRIRNPQLLVFASPAMTSALQNVQWSPLLIAASMLWPASWLLACKPNLAAALLAWRPSWRSVLIAGGFTLVTIAIAPWWPGAWLATLHSTAHMEPFVMRPGGFLLLAAALRWRRPEARLLLALAGIPQTPVIYEAVALFLVVQTLREGVVLLVLMLVASTVSVSRIALPEPQWLAWNAVVFTWVLYLPCLVMVLRRPNEGDVPASVDAFLRRTALRLRRAQ